MTLSGRRTWSVLNFRKMIMGAVAVPSSSTTWNLSFKLGWPTVPDKPENEMMGAPVKRNSPDGWRAPNFSGNSQ